MKKNSIEQKYKVYERHFEKAKADSKKYFNSKTASVYRKLNKEQFEEIYNEFYKGNKNYARQIIYDFNKDARYSEKQADNAAKMLYNFANGETPDNLRNILSTEDIEYIKNIIKGENKEESLKRLKERVLRGKFYDQSEKIYDKVKNNPEVADKGTVEHSYLFGSP